MLLPIIGIFLGILLGVIFGGTVSVVVAEYLSVIAIVALDSLLEGGKKYLDDTFKSEYLLYTFIATALLSCLLVFFGHRVGLDIYLVAIVALGIRIFQNLNKIIALLIARKSNKKFINTASHYTED